MAKSAKVPGVSDWIGKPCHGVLERHGEEETHDLLVFDVDKHREGFDELVESAFGDGFIDGYLDDDDKWINKDKIPFALWGGNFDYEDGVGENGDYNGLLLYDVASGAVLSIDIDGTAVQEEPYEVAASIAALQIEAGSIDGDDDDEEDDDD